MMRDGERVSRVGECIEMATCDYTNIITRSINFDSQDMKCLKWYIKHYGLKNSGGTKVTINQAISSMVSCFVEETVVPLIKLKGIKRLPK